MAIKFKETHWEYAVSDIYNLCERERLFEDEHSLSSSKELAKKIRKLIFSWIPEEKRDLLDTEDEENKDWIHHRNEHLNHSIKCNLCALCCSEVVSEMGLVDDFWDFGSEDMVGIMHQWAVRDMDF